LISTIGYRNKFAYQRPETGPNSLQHASGIDGGAQGGKKHICGNPQVDCNGVAA